MAKGQMRSNREQKKPKKQKAEIAAASSVSSVLSRPLTTIKNTQYAKRGK